MATAKKSLLKGGYLLKRQRGKSPNADLKRLRFRQRYVRLDENTLEYFEDQKKGVKKGSFPVDQIRIVESVPDVTFGKAFCFQIGDKEEVMYFRAKTEKERKEWMEVFRIACVTLNKNEMYDWYHTGAYGQVDSNKWSCCNVENRESQGCRKTTSTTQRQRLSSLSTQWQRRSPSLEVPTNEEEISASVPIYPNPSSTTNWGDEDIHDEIEYIQSTGSEETLISDQANSSHVERSEYTHGSRDSGLDEESNKLKYGSQGSLLSSKGFSMSPSSYHCHLNQSFSNLVENVIPETEMIVSSWKDLDELKLPESQSEITLCVFRGTSTLITASKEGYVHVTDAVETKTRPNSEYTSAAAVGSVDVWKNYLVLGFPDIQIADLDTQERKRLNSVEVEAEQCGQLVSFTPEGWLLSCNKSEPCCICIWPNSIASLWPNLPDHEMKADSLEIKDAQVIQSLSVSPEPNQPLVAAVFKLKGLEGKMVRIYNYKTKQLKQEFELKEKTSKPAILAFHPYGKYIVIVNGKSLLIYDHKKQSHLFQCTDFANYGQYITSLCFYPTGSHLTIGLNTGEVKSYGGLPSSPQLLASLTKPQLTPASSLSYSKDCRTLAVGHRNGTVQLWEVPRLTMSETDHDTPLLGVRELSITGDGAQFVSVEDGYMISVPPGAVPVGSTVTLRHGIVPHGYYHQFQFPDGVRPVSSILSLQPSMKQNFLAPFSIALPHCIHCETSDDCTKLAIFKACHEVGEDGRPIYHFQPMPTENLSLFSVQNRKNGAVIPYAAYSSDHCCYWCVGRIFKEDTDKAMFCLVEARPKHNESREQTIHYCLPYYLPTCLETVKEQFPDKEYDLKLTAVTFSGDNDPFLSINFENEVNGWRFKLQGGDKIYKKDVCFWDYPSCPVLVEMCKNKQYPPRFILDVDGRRATESTIARVSFPGAKECFKRATPFSDLKFVCYPQDLQHNTSGRSLTSTASEPLSVSIDTFQSTMSEFTDVNPGKMAFYFFSKHLISYDDCMKAKKASTSPNSDTEEINMDLLMKVYQVLLGNPSKIDAAYNVLEKLRKQKLPKDSDIYKKHSRSASACSSTYGGSYTSAQEQLSEPETESTTVAAEVESGNSGDSNHECVHPLESSPVHTGSQNSYAWFSCASPIIIEPTNLVGIAPFISPIPTHGRIIPELTITGEEQD